MEIILFLLVLILDQVTKYIVNNTLALSQSIPVIDGVFQITNVHNTGAAWGMLAGGRTLFLIITPVLCIGLLYVLFRHRRQMSIIGRIMLTLLLAGAVGNFIDRLWLHYVRDMLDFCLIHFPVFNVADSAITIGAILLIIDTFFCKEKAVLSLLEKKENDKQAKQDSGWIRVDMGHAAADDATFEEVAGKEEAEGKADGENTDV